MYYTENDGMSYNGQKHLRRVGEHSIVTWSRRIDGDHPIEVEAGACAGDAGPGQGNPRVYLRIKNADGAKLHCRVQYVSPDSTAVKEIQLAAGGIDGLASIKEALRFAISILEIQTEKAG